MNKSLSFTILTAFVVLCSCLEMNPSFSESQPFFAQIEEITSTKTVMDANNNIRWLAEDQITVFAKSPLALKYQVADESIGNTSARFELVSENNHNNLNTSIEWDSNVAYYPYSEVISAKESGHSYSLSAALPSEQTYSPASFGNGTMPMVAISENNNFTFKNVCGGMKLQLKGNQKIVAIQVEGKNEEKLSGNSTVTVSQDNALPDITMNQEANTSVTLVCNSGVQLSNIKTTDFIIVLPPVDFTNGFTVKITDNCGQTSIIETNKFNRVLRSSLLVMPEVTLAKNPVDYAYGDYIDEYGINQGQGINIDGTIWAPVNCGYHEVDFKYGKLYQWGRKFGQGYDGVRYTGDGNNPSVYYSDALIPDTERGGVSLYDGQLPTYANVFFVSGVTEEYDWVCPHTETLWNAGTETAPIKTDFDPCPNGWRVPTARELSNLCINKSEWSTNQLNQPGYWFCGSQEYSIAVPQIFLPAAGSRGGSGVCNSRDSQGWYWSSKPTYDDYYDQYYAYAIYYSTSFNVTRPTESRSIGKSVRCVRDLLEPSEPLEKEHINLAYAEPANCYILTEPGYYRFPTVKGNNTDTISYISEVAVLWETFGTSTSPNVGDLIQSVKYKNGEILLKTADIYKEGNAVIGAKSSEGVILWSWHLWFTDQPVEQSYKNNAGSMMDRNLGATSATPGDVCALGLLYQWGRKDPFLGSSSISQNVTAKSTGVWPSRVVQSSEAIGTIDYITENPMAFIGQNTYNEDWYFTGNSQTDNTRWQSEKTIYDPCPAGWRVPDGGINGIWHKAGFSNVVFDNVNKGMIFNISDSSVTWYPLAGTRNCDYSNIQYVAQNGNYWSVTPDENLANELFLYNDGDVYTNKSLPRSMYASIRCQKE